MKLLVFDNYDSFTYNLVHIVKKLGFTDVEVHRNDRISLEEINRFDKIILSPGPGVPSESGILLELIKTYASSKSIFGVCLGVQAIAEAFGGSLLNLPQVYHGIASEVSIFDDEVLFRNLPEKIIAGRYHSWVVNDSTLPPCLQVTAKDEQGTIMALKHRTLDGSRRSVSSESVLTPSGEQILKNWLEFPLSGK